MGNAILMLDSRHARFVAKSMGEYLNRQVELVEMIHIARRLMTPGRYGVVITDPVAFKDSKADYADFLREVKEHLPVVIYTARDARHELVEAVHYSFYVPRVIGGGVIEPFKGLRDVLTIIEEAESRAVSA